MNKIGLHIVHQLIYDAINLKYIRLHAKWHPADYKWRFMKIKVVVVLFYSDSICILCQFLIYTNTTTDHEIFELK